ncbi:hypothetical protein Sjap_007549 [Stephania japonica]|uniref:Uncharacterized protein n=1 Tax=Stephania japonica TaxID=461633 RepID=A0AAP0JNP9_9MAGN
MADEELTEEDRKALRGSKFAPLPSTSRRSHQPRLAHPGGPLTTNKAAALAKFLERKLQEPGGLDSMNPALVELAVKNAKETVHASGKYDSGRLIRHVSSFDDAEDFSAEDKGKSQVNKKEMKPKKLKRKNKGKKKAEDHENPKPGKPKKKKKL